MKSTTGCSWLRDWFLRGLAGLVLLVAGLILLFSCTRVQAQGGYEVTDIMPAPGMVELDTRFYFTIVNNGVPENWLMNMAGFVIYSDGRAPEYMLLRIDNL